MATVKKAREWSTQVKDLLDVRTTGPKVDKPSSARDACVSDLLKTLLSSSACAKLVDQIHQTRAFFWRSRMKRLSFCFKKHTNMTCSYDKVLAKFDTTLKLLKYPSLRPSLLHTSIST